MEKIMLGARYGGSAPSTAKSVTTAYHDCDGNDLRTDFWGICSHDYWNRLVFQIAKWAGKLSPAEGTPVE